MLQKIVIIGQAGVGKSQIRVNLMKGKGAVFLENRKETAIMDFGILNGGMQLWDISGRESPEKLWLSVLNHACLVLVVIDHETLRDDGGSGVLAKFLKIAAENAPGAQVKIVVNKIDQESVFTIDKSNIQTDNEAENLLSQPIEPPNVDRVENIKSKCCPQIFAAAYLPTGFDIDKDVIYYSAKEQAEKLSHGAPLAEDPIYAQLIELGIVPNPAESVEIEEKSKITAQASKKSSHKESFLPEIDWLFGWEQEIKPTLIVAGKALLFLLIAAGLTAVFGAIGFGIGFAAGAWAGPGAFFTAIAGTLAGVVTAGSLAILVVAPLLGFAVTGIGFGLWHREPPQSPDTTDVKSTDDLGYSFIGNPDDLNRGKNKGVDSALEIHQSQAVLGGAKKPPETSSQTNDPTFTGSTTNDPK